MYPVVNWATLTYFLLWNCHFTLTLPYINISLFSLWCTSINWFPFDINARLAQFGSLEVHMDNLSHIYTHCKYKKCGYNFYLNQDKLHTLSYWCHLQKTVMFTNTNKRIHKTFVSADLVRHFRIGSFWIAPVHRWFRESSVYTASPCNVFRFHLK